MDSEFERADRSFLLLTIRFMKFDFEIQQHPAQNYVAANALSRTLTSQANNSQFDGNIPAYAAADIHAITDHNAEEEAELLTIQAFLGAQKEDASCRLLAEIAKASMVIIFRTNSAPFQGERDWMEQRRTSLLCL